MNSFIIKYTLLIGFMFCLPNCYGQAKEMKDFNKMVDSYLNFTVPTISVEELSQNKSKPILLDAREKVEYDLSHIPEARYLGYDEPDFKILKTMPKDTQIVVYCSIGYRSEKMGEKLKKMGFTNVKNLYGSLFAWANAKKPLVNRQNRPTTAIHTFNKKWSKWVLNKDLIIVY